ncbi:hypothetical protein [Pseudomonas sp. McL0111]|uniref:hypothetical protein n=1 Tax=Pseudomonas sp. McL0111 TaxID=3457357 RepID=UPI00403EEFD8
MKVSSSGNSQMRVLVADQQCAQRIVIEKSLSLLGYFRVCPVSSFEELTLLSHYSPNLYERFDLLIVNAELISAAGINAADFCLNNSRFRHVLIYDSSRERRGIKTLSTVPHHQVRVVDAMGFEVLTDFLALIDKNFKRDKLKPLSVKAA